MALPTFKIRDLHAPSQHGVIDITDTQYDDTLRSHRDSALTYVDYDDGETVTVGSALELRERLDEPSESQKTRRGHPTQMPAFSVDDQKVHVFDIQRTAETLAVWREHASRTRDILHTASPSASPRPSKTVSIPISPISSQTTSFTALPSGNSMNGILSTVEEVMQTACSGLETHIGGFASFLDLTATALQAAARKTREADTTPIENVLAGLRGVLLEVGQIGMDVLREFESERSRPRSTAPYNTVKHEPPPESLSAVEKHTRTPLQKSIPASETPPSAIPIFATTFKQPNPPIFGSGPALENASRPAPSVPAHRGFPTRPAPPPPSHPAALASKSDGPKSLMDEDSSNAEFSARYPPLSLKRAKTIGALRRDSAKDDLCGSTESTRSALTRYPSIGQLESRTESQRARIRAAARRIATKALEDNVKERSLRGYRKPVVEEEPQSVKATTPDSGGSKADSAQRTIESFYGPPTPRSTKTVLTPKASGPKPGTTLQRSKSVTLPALPKSPALSCRMTSPPTESFEQPTGGLRRAQTVTASNPAARLNGPFDPMDGAPRSDASSIPVYPHVTPRRSLTQHLPRLQTSEMRPAVHQRSTLWSNFNHQMPNRGPQAPLHAFPHRPAMPGAFPMAGPPPHLQHIRHMRSEPNFAQQVDLDAKVNNCIKTLTDMGYGMDVNEKSRLPIYAGANAGDVSEAIEMLEEERRAAKDMLS